MDSKNQLKDLLKNLKCAICHDVLIDATVTNCGHSFCKWCIKKWHNDQFDVSGNGKDKLAKCPMCKTEIETLSSNHMLKNHIEEMCNLLLSEEDKSDRKQTMNQHLRLFEAAKTSAQLVHPPNSVNTVQIPIETIDIDDSDDESDDNSDDVNPDNINAMILEDMSHIRITLATAETAPLSQETLQENIDAEIERTVYFYTNPIETIDLEGSDNESDDNLDIVSPDNFNALTNEGMTHIRETPATVAPETVETVRQETNQENIDTEIERATIAAAVEAREFPLRAQVDISQRALIDEITRPLVLRNLSASDSSVAMVNIDAPTPAPEANTQKNEEVPHIRERTSPSVSRNPSSAYDIENNSATVETSLTARKSQKDIRAQMRADNLRFQEMSWSLFPSNGSTSDMSIPDSTGQDTYRSSNRHSQGHGSIRGAPRSSPYNLDDRPRNRG